MMEMHPAFVILDIINFGTANETVTLLHTYEKYEKKGVVIIEAARLVRLPGDLSSNKYFGFARIRYQFVYSTANAFPLSILTWNLPAGLIVIGNAGNPSTCVANVLQAIKNVLGCNAASNENTGQARDLEIADEALCVILPESAAQMAVVEAGNVLLNFMRDSKETNSLTVQNQRTLQRSHERYSCRYKVLAAVIASCLLFLFKKSIGDQLDNNKIELQNAFATQLTVANNTEHIKMTARLDELERIVEAMTRNHTQNQGEERQTRDNI
eukprot:GEMP01045493.1.p1 GENE.GEMP01045493.1~~GEMP01045493.1.p1  ORF type:complete len:269 (+),score=19.88 GEMP01045493.1:460-1266(+)